MTKIVINNGEGGDFDLSVKGTLQWAELHGFKLFAYKGSEYTKNHKFVPFEGDEVDNFDTPLYTTRDVVDMKDFLDREKPQAWFNWADENIPRDDPALVQVVEELGIDASAPYASLAVVEIPDGIEWFISECCGVEIVHEKHRRWGVGWSSDEAKTAEQEKTITEVTDDTEAVS